MSRPQKPSSSSARLGLGNGTPNIRQRAPLPTPQDSSSRPPYGPRYPAPSLHRDRKGKGKEKEKVKGRWEVGTKGWVKEGFRQFGAHCARNQIRTLLIDCLVMTNLFYPSVVVWYQKRTPVTDRMDSPISSQAGPSRSRYDSNHSYGHGEHGHEDPLSVFSTPLLDSFFPDSTPILPHFSPQGWWSDHDDRSGQPIWNVTSVETGDYLVGPIEEEEVRMVTIAWIDVDTALSQDVVGYMDRDDSQNTLGMIDAIKHKAETWQDKFPGSRERCIRELASSGSPDGIATSDGGCYLFSSGFRDQSLKSLSEVAIPSSTDLDDRESTFYRSISAFFRIPRSATSAFNTHWESAVRDISNKSGGQVYKTSNKRDVPTEWRLALTSATSPSSIRDQSDTPVHADKIDNKYGKYFILGYAAMFLILVFQVNFATRVHSKFGLAVTGIVQLICSAIMSLSVLALIGWNGWGWSSLPSSVPAWVLPMVIVIVGVENMSTLTKAVFSVPFHYSVPERIGLGLSRSGLKILFTSLTNILALAIIWFFVDVAPVREFCLFAITVNITDWFMLHTFYLTVLSIDAQRLELADVLATSGNQDPATQAVSTEEPDDDTHILSWRGLLASRMFNSGTLVLTLVCVGVIYFVTDRGTSSLSTPASIYQQAKQTLGAIPRSIPFSTSNVDLLELSQPEIFWRSLNPSGWPFIRLVIPTASIVILPTSGNPFSPLDVLKMTTPARRRLPRLKPFFYLFKVFVFPQALTAGSLWALLAYLLKDADLLDAQRDRGGRGEDIPLKRYGTKSSQDSQLASQLRVDMMPCGHPADIEIVTSSAKGNLVLSVGVDDSISLWRFHQTLGTGTRELLRSSPALTSIVAAAISADEGFVAVADEDGTVQIWQLRDNGDAVALNPCNLSFEDSKVRINQVVFDDIVQESEDPFRTPVKGIPSAPPAIVVICSDASVTRLRVSEPNEILIESRESTSEAVMLRTDNSSAINVLVAGDYEESIYRAADDWSSTPLHSHRTAGDGMTAVSPLRHVESLTRKHVFAIGRKSGLVEVFSTSGTLIGAVGQSGGMASIRQVDIASPSSSRCTGCNVTSDEGFFVISSSGDQVYIDRIMPPNTLVCRCSASRRSLDESTRMSINNPSKSSDSISASLVVPPSVSRARVSPSSSPRKSPSLLPPVSNGEFPLSSHGTRKLSLYHSHDSLQSTPTSANLVAGNGTAVNSMGLSINGNGNVFSESDTHLGEPQPQAITPDWTDMEVFPLGSISTPDGQWIVVDDTLIGLLRSSPGISHDQWQIWTVDLTQPYNGSTLNISTASFSALELTTRRALYESLYDSTGEIPSELKRTERLQSLSGKATFPPIRGSISVPTYPTLAYIDVSEFQKKGEKAFVAAFGNQLGVITLPERRKEEGMNIGVGLTPRSRLNSTSARPMTLGLTPPPPRKFEEKKVL